MEMAVSLRHILVYFAALSLVPDVYGASYYEPLLRKVGPEFSKTIVVDASGKGDFKTVQAAIDSVPFDNRRWIHIMLKAGVYREKVNIPPGKSFIFMEGEGRKTTTIAWDDTAAKFGTFQSATFTLYASHFIAKRISFNNTFQPSGSEGLSPAVAALISGDNAAFYGCGFSSIQDTLCDLSGRHYFKKCHIEGAIDFIFGAGQSIYKNCTLFSTALQIGYITAQGRDNRKDSLKSGYVFDGCRVMGTGQVFLGRAWRPLSRVIFTNTYMSDIVDPAGWDSWGGPTSQLVYAEHNCHGPGSNTSQRVKWATTLTGLDVAFYTGPLFVDVDGWTRPRHESFARLVPRNASSLNGSFPIVIHTDPHY